MHAVKLVQTHVLGYSSIVLQLANKSPKLFSFFTFPVSTKHISSHEEKEPTFHPANTVVHWKRNGEESQDKWHACYAMCFFGFHQFSFAKSPGVRFIALKRYLSNSYARIDNETGGIQRNTLYIADIGDEGSSSSYWEKRKEWKSR